MKRVIYSTFSSIASGSAFPNLERKIIPEFPSILVYLNGPGNTDNRSVGHYARRGSTTISGGTWSLSNSLLGSATISINSSTGLVTFSGVSQSGAYTIKYTHTDGISTELSVDIIYNNTEAAPRVISASPTTVSWISGSTSSVTVNHTIKESSSTLSGGTWSIASSSNMTVSINSSTGVASVTSVTANGYYTVEYEHTDLEITEATINSIFYPPEDSGSPDPDYNIP